MKHFIGHHLVASTDEVLELAIGTPLDLWLGVDNESEEERAARLDAARDILADDPELTDRLTTRAALALDVHPADVLRVVALPVPMPRPSGRHRRTVPARAA
jgi:hypothetical protein